MPAYGWLVPLKIWIRKDWHTGEWLVSPRQFGYPVTIRTASFVDAITTASEVAQELREGSRAAAPGEAA